MSVYVGWSGRLLFVDLTARAWRHVDSHAYLPGFIGGRGLGAALAWELLREGMGPLDPDSPLMFLPGPLSGTMAPSAGRVTLCALSPQSYPLHWFTRSSMGGDLGHHLRYAGYDGIIITGQAAEPTVLTIHDDLVALHNADELWGQGIMDTQALLRQRYGQRAQVAAIGPAGESLSCIATIGSNEGSAAGQGGLGAVMGAKRLKALVVEGTGRPRLANAEGFRAMTRAIAQETLQDQRHRSGAQASSQAPYGQRRLRCSTGCIAGCATHYEQVPGTLFPERRYEGVRQCTSGRFDGAEGHYWKLGFEAGFELNVTASDWGINHWDLMKGLFPWIGMCHRAGLLPDIGGRAVELNSPAFWYEVLEAIAYRRGPMAEIVADGGRRAMARTGLLPDEARQLYTGWGYANHWDGRGPRGNRIPYPFWLVSALLWMVDTRDPMGSAHGYVQDMLRASPFEQGFLDWPQLQAIAQQVYGRAAAADPLSDYEGKAEPALWHLRRSLLKDSLPLCDRVFPRLWSSTADGGLPMADGVPGPEYEARLYSLATGHEVDAAGLESMAERALIVERLQQMRDQGRSRAMDDTVLTFFCETEEEFANPLLGERRHAEPAPLRRLADAFFELRGWDVDSGNPTEAQARAALPGGAGL